MSNFRNLYQVVIYNYRPDVKKLRISVGYGKQSLESVVAWYKKKHPDCGDICIEPFEFFSLNTLN